MELSIVVPVFNEEGNLRPLHHELLQNIPERIQNYEIIFVDDGSNDSSSEILEDLSSRYDAVKLVKFADNFGQTQALQAGFDNAKGDYIVTLDADMQNDPKDIPDLMEVLISEDLDMVSGWRKERQDPFFKIMSSNIASVLRRFLLNTDLHDYGCTLKIYKKEAAKDLKLYGEMHRYIPPLLDRKGYEVSEREVNHRERRSGETKYGLKRLPRGFIDLIGLWASENQEVLKRIFTDLFWIEGRRDKIEGSRNYKITEVV
ncbi:MAG: glycosyltransferase involved in cell wall biosynthesis [Candidatus Nanohaloarchaea archaeon]|jgi:glycosyltransferase involved in cell wall biosynthesis